MKNGKTPGLDKIPPEANKVVANLDEDWLLGVLNELLWTQVFPDEWKHANVVFIPKQGRDPKLTHSYKPLCLLNTMSKVYVALISDRLNREV